MNHKWISTIWIKKAYNPHSKGYQTLQQSFLPIGFTSLTHCNMTPALHIISLIEFLWLNSRYKAFGSEQSWPVMAMTRVPLANC